MIRRPPRSTLFPTRRSSDLNKRTGNRRFFPRIGIRRAVASRPFRPVRRRPEFGGGDELAGQDRKSTRLNSSHVSISYAVFCLKKKKKKKKTLSKQQITHQHL